MISVLSGTNLTLELLPEVDEKKTCFFRGDRRLKVPKLDLFQRELISYYYICAKGILDSNFNSAVIDKISYFHEIAPNFILYNNRNN